MNDIMLLHTSVMNVSMGATVTNHLKNTKPTSIEAIFISAIYVKNVSSKKRP